MKCEKCLYRKNCQFLAKHPKADVDGCTAFESEAELREQIAREIFDEIYEDCFDQFGYVNYEALAELKNKYTEDQSNE